MINKSNKSNKSNKNNKNNKNIDYINLKYKNKYFKYKNKYFKLTGGISGTTTIIIISILISILGLSGVILYNQYPAIDSNKMSLKYTFYDKFNDIYYNRNVTTKKMNDFIIDQFKFAHLNLCTIIKEITDNKNITNNKEITDNKKISNNNKITDNNNSKTKINEIILNYILKTQKYTPYYLIKSNPTDAEPDTFIQCLIKLMAWNQINTTPHKSYEEIKKRIIQEIENTTICDHFFDKNRSSTLDHKKAYIEHIRNQNSVSDFPMICIAASIYKVCFIVKVELYNKKYLKIFGKLKHEGGRKNVIRHTNRPIILEYINKCDYNCDFTYNSQPFNILPHIKINTQTDKQPAKHKHPKYSESKNIILNMGNIKINSNESSDDSIDLNETNLKNMEFTKSINITEDENSTENLFNSKFIHKEKQEKQEKHNMLPYYQVYKYYNNSELKQIEEYYNTIII